VEKQIRCQDNCNQFSKRVKIVFSKESRLEGYLIRWIDMGWNLDPITTHPSEFQFLVCVRCVIEPLPSEGKKDDHHVFKKNRNFQFSQELKVVFYQIRIGHFGKVVVMAETGVNWGRNGKIIMSTSHVDLTVCCVLRSMLQASSNRTSR
jgi:hypothetical protein